MSRWGMDDSGSHPTCRVIVHLDQLPTTSKCICGAFKVSTNANNSLHFIHFLLPEVKIKDGNLHLEWTKFRS
jgi:hypothetical protein